jgi:hypothetical protein
MYHIKHHLHGIFHMDFQLSNAKHYFKQGLFSGFYLVKYGTGYTIELHYVDTTMTVSRLVDARNREVKVFKTIDAAVKMAEQIGFSVDCLTSCKTETENVS